ncbi:MAG: trigger factor [Bacilli bacterium]|nr:trigger factor [Bacilli bacterium]
MKKNVIEKEITIEGKAWEEALDKAFTKLNKKAKIDGFRPGSAPKKVYLKHYGVESLYQEAMDKVVDEAYKKALEETKAIPVVEPTLDIKSIDEKSVTFKFTFITKPEVTLGDYKNLGIKKKEVKVTKKEIDEEIEKLKNEYAEVTTKEDGVVEKGDTAVIDFDGFVDGKALDGGHGENYPLEIGSNTFIPGFEDGLLGLKVGDTKTLNLKFPEDYVEDLKGKKVKFDVKVNEIKTRVLPELGTEFYLDLGMDDVKTEEDLRKEIEKNIREEKKAHAEDEYIEECLSKASKNMKVDINEEIIDEEVHRMIHQLEDQLKMQGLNMETYQQFTGITHEKMHEQMEPEARKRVEYRYLLDAIADKEKIEFTKEEVEAKAKEMADNYGISVDELIKAYGSMDIVKYDMRMHKAIEIVKGE